MHRYPPSSWHHCIDMVTYLLNIFPSKTIQFESPPKMLYKKYTSYSHLHLFGCLCYPFFRSTTIQKLQPRSTTRVFLGYPSNHRGYKSLYLSLNKNIFFHITKPHSPMQICIPNPLHTPS